ncbi:MAG: helix-turn-helix domain-containing protein [Clostridiaceae bacterium]|nr:helix-turn-helix domain-containing protein [Clostridiaceae bacterium]
MKEGDEMNTAECIKYFRQKENITQKQLAEKTGLSIASIQGYEQNKYNPKLETLKKIADALDISIFDLIDPSEFMPLEDFLITCVQSQKINGEINGEIKCNINYEKYRQLCLYLGKMLKNTDETTHEDEEFKLIKHFRHLNSKGKKEAEKRISELTELKKYTQKSSENQEASAPENKIIVLPYFRAGVFAGSGIFILGNEAEDEIELPDLPEYEAADFAIDVNGDSMEPDFSHEDIALVQQDAELFPGDIGVFVVNSNAFIKELGKNELISRNKDYKNIPIHDGDNVVCMGKVIGKVKTDEE